MKMTIWCNHYRAMSEHKTCEAGVDYDTMKGQKFEDRPCFWRRRSGAAKPCSCPHATYPTDAEIAADEAESRKHMEKIGKARTAIVAHLGGPWKKGMAGATGQIDCPACGNTKTLLFSRAGYNGHIHAKCGTPDCVAWME
jgi:hypothetical protein